MRKTPVIVQVFFVVKVNSTRFRTYVLPYLLVLSFN